MDGISSLCLQQMLEHICFDVDGEAFEKAGDEFS
jgi:hypothetical protein